MPFLGKTPTKLLDANVNIDGGNIDGTTIGATSAASATVTTFTSTGIDDNATSTAITIDSSGQVIISGNGGSTVNSLDLTYNGSSGQANIQADSDGGDTFLTFGTSASGAVAEHMRITSSGNVGIGTASPSSFNQVGADTLVVGSGSGEQGITIYSGTANNGVLAFADGTTTTQQYEGYIGYNHSSSFMRFFTGATERMRIDSVGSMGLGTAGAPNTLSSNATTLNIKGSVTTKTGAIWLQSSDESLSSYLYQDSTNLTLGTLSNHNLRFVTNNSERMRIDTSGRLLLGTTSSVSVTGGDRQFQISGTNGVTSSAVIRRSQNSGGAPSLSFAKDRGSVSTAVVSGDALGAIYFAGSDGTDLTNDAASIIGSADGTPSSNNTPGRLAFYTNGGSVSSTERMRINSTGSLILTGGGGTVTDTHGTASRTNLQLDGSSETIVTFSQSGTTRGYLNAASNSFDLVAGTGSKLRLLSNGSGSNAVTLDTSGKVQIGTNAGNFTDALLTTRQAGNVIDWGHGNTAGYGSTLGSNSGSGAPFIGFNCGAGTTSNTFKTTGFAGSLIHTDNAGSLLFSRVTSANADNQSSTETMRINTTGHLLVGTSTAMGGGGSDGLNGFGAQGIGGGRFVVIQNQSDANMYLAKNSGYSNNTYVWFYVTGSQIGSIAKSGSGVAYNTTSDQRLKENIVDAPAGNIDAIQVRSFNWKESGAHQTYGMIAQELVAVAPEAVTQPEDPEEMMGVDYSKLVPMMIKEIQDLRARVAQLEGA